MCPELRLHTCGDFKIQKTYKKCGSRRTNGWMDGPAKWHRSNSVYSFRHQQQQQILHIHTNVNVRCIRWRQWGVNNVWLTCREIFQCYNRNKTHRITKGCCEAVPISFSAYMCMYVCMYYIHICYITTSTCISLASSSVWMKNTLQIQIFI